MGGILQYFVCSMRMWQVLHDCGILRNRANFNENLSMRAIVKFCEHEQASTCLNFASKSSKGQIL